MNSTCLTDTCLKANMQPRMHMLTLNQADITNTQLSNIPYIAQDSQESCHIVCIKVLAIQL